MIVTIDGPAGSGKSTAARELADRLGMPYLDTGAMYRAVALRAIEQGMDLEDGQALAELARQSDFELDFSGRQMRIRLDGRDVTKQVRSMQVTQATPYVARVLEVREVLVARQQQVGTRLGSLVAEGRDQGSKVFAHADIKFLLDATIERRADRRYAELQADGEQVSRQQVLEDMRKRDGTDSSQWAPLLEAGGVRPIDTTDMSIAQVVDMLEGKVRQHMVRQGKQ